MYFPGGFAFEELKKKIETLAIDLGARGEFLKLSSLAGLATVGGGAAGKIGSWLFKGGESDLLISKVKNLVFWDTSPILSGTARAYYLSRATEEEIEVRKSFDFKMSESEKFSYITMTSPKGRHLSFGVERLYVPSPWTPRGVPVDYLSPMVEVPPGEDPHISFMIAASQLQRRIDNDVQSFASILNEMNLAMCTLVHSPIMAYSYVNGGYALGTSLEVFAARPEDIQNLSGAYSEVGEIPLETPGDIEFKYLILLEEQISALGMHPKDIYDGTKAAARRQALSVFRKRHV